MGNNEDGFDVQTSDQTASSPTSEQTPADPPQIDSLDDTRAHGLASDSPNGDIGAPAQDSEDTGNSNVSVSDDTAHTPTSHPSTRK